MSPNDFFTRKTIRHTKGIEKEIGREYALLFADAKIKLAELYAKIGSSPTLEEAQKYNRLNNLVIEIRKAYQRLTGRTITKTEMAAKYNFVQEYYGAMWSAELAHGAFKWKNPAVEAIRASVYWEGTGLSLPKRFGKNFISSITRVEETITRGLANGTGYAKLAEELKDVFTGGLNDALRVIRTESNRNRTEGMNAAFDQMKDAGLPVKKIWISAQDERTRGAKPKDKYNHLILDGLVSDEEGMFDVGQGIGKIEGPTLSGVAGFDINCRCSVAPFFDDEPRATQAELDASYKAWEAENNVNIDAMIDRV
jgi:hypothetical protein